MEDNVIPLPNTDRQYWLEQAGYWGEKEEDAERALEYAKKQRAKALRMLGMLGIREG